MYIPQPYKAPPVTFSAFPEVVKDQLFEADYSTDLHCEISDPPAKACWYEDGVELISESQPHLKKEDSRRTLAVKTAQASKSGRYDCMRKDDVIQFNVQDEGDFWIFACNLLAVLEWQLTTLRSV